MNTYLPFGRRTLESLSARGRGGGSFVFTLLLAATVLTGCATKSDIRDIQQEMATMSQRQEDALGRLEASTESSRAQLREDQETMLDDVQGEILTRLRTIEQDVGELRELLRQIERDQALLRDEIANMSARSAARPMVSMPGDTMAMAPGGMQADPGDAEVLFADGLEQKNGGSLSAARIAFDEFVRSYPDHPRAPQAYFHLGDVYSRQDAHDQALEAFLRVPELYPESGEVAKCIYRAAMSSIDLGRPDDARRYLRMVVDDYPDDPSAELAQIRLDEIGG